MRLLPSDRYVVALSGCWQWRGSPNSSGYGNVRVGGKTRAAHRYIYELHRGPIPAGLDLDHLCRNRMCVNPDHLEPVTRRANTLRGLGISAVNATKDACVNGHPFDAANTYIHPQRGSRLCRACNRDSVQRYKARKQVQP